MTFWTFFVISSILYQIQSPLGCRQLYLIIKRSWSMGSFQRTPNRISGYRTDWAHKEYWNLNSHYSGRCCFNSLTNKHVCKCPDDLEGSYCERLRPQKLPKGPTGPENPMNATLSVILAAVIVFFLCLVVIVIYCTSEQRRKTKRKQAKRLSRDEGKRSSNNHERNNRENEIITENPNRFKPDNQTTRNINGRYNGSNHESISLLNVCTTILTWRHVLVATS